MKDRIVRFALAASLLALAIPGTAVGAPPQGSCAGEVNVAQALPVPADFRAPGVHRLQRQYFVTFADGHVEDWGVVENVMEITSEAPVYENVLIRVVSSWGLRADGTIDRPIFAMRADQVATFYSQFGWLKSDPIASVEVLLRYETRKNRWTDWQVLPSSPQTALCNQKDSVIRKSYGWAG